MILIEYDVGTWNEFIQFSTGSVGYYEREVNSCLGDYYLLKKDPGVGN
jgi:hypothetical protein